MPEAIYIRLDPGGKIPERCERQPYRAVVVVESEISNDWRNSVSDWLVATGCLYMLAWGAKCSLWDDAVDWASLEEWDFGDIPPEHFVMTTWHENEELSETFWFAKACATHPEVPLERTVIVHISGQDRRRELLEEWRNA